MMHFRRRTQNSHLQTHFFHCAALVLMNATMRSRYACMFLARMVSARLCGDTEPASIHMYAWCVQSLKGIIILVKWFIVTHDSLSLDVVAFVKDKYGVPAFQTCRSYRHRRALFLLFTRSDSFVVRVVGR